MFRSSPSRRSLVIASLALGLATGCSEPSVATDADAFDEASCDTSFEARVSRPGSQRQARLSYGCAADLCGVDEAFAAGTMQLVTIDVPSTVASSVKISSSDPGVIRTMSMEASLDPCLGLTRAYVSLEARAAGTAALRVTAEGVTDELLVVVSQPAAISLRASPLHQLELSVPGEITIEAGHPLLIVPSLQTAAGAPLRGLPTLIWAVTDEAIASVRLEAKSEDERFLREWAAPNGIFLDAQRIGTTQVQVRSESGTEGSMTVHVIEPKTTPYR